jgi:DNA-directed RNA polymerase specialized sigma24 family protein
MSNNKKVVRRVTPPPTAAPAALERHVLSERFADPDLVDRIFDYVVQLLPQFAEQAADVKNAVREEFDGERAYIRADRRSVLGSRVLAEFNGRNASEVARRLGCSRATVYRLIKQPGKR